MNSATSASSVLIQNASSLPVIGALQGEVWLTVQTYQAQSLVRGRRRSEDKSAIVGLVGFADRLRTLWQAARQDDPYADWWLIKIENAIGLCRARMNVVLEECEILMENQSSLEVMVAESSKPHRIALHFANPYAFRGAQMLAEFDQLVCMLATLHHVGVELPLALREQADSAGRWVRRVFALPLDYLFCDIDRMDVINKTQRAVKALEKMGEVPGDILQGEKTPALKPKPSNSKPHKFSLHLSKDKEVVPSKLADNDDVELKD